jgi:hypothetical protein
MSDVNPTSCKGIATRYVLTAQAAPVKDSEAESGGRVQK